MRPSLRQVSRKRAAVAVARIIAPEIRERLQRRRVLRRPRPRQPRRLAVSRNRFIPRRFVATLTYEYYSNLRILLSCAKVAALSRVARSLGPRDWLSNPREQIV